MEIDNIHRKVVLWLLEPGTCQARSLESFVRKILKSRAMGKLVKARRVVTGQGCLKLSLWLRGWIGGTESLVWLPRGETAILFILSRHEEGRRIVSSSPAWAT